MKNFSLLIFAAFLLSSFTICSTKETGFINPGVYALSVTCDNTETITSGLVIHEDQTFLYFDKTKNKEIEGTWTIVGSELVLQTGEQLPIASVWKIDEHGKCLKSRTRFTYYRSCNC